MKLKTIVVPFDGSIVAEAALTPAIDLAREAGAKLVLLRAAEAHPLPMADPVEAQVSVMRDAQDYLAAVRQRAVTAGVAEVDASAWYGSPVEAIVEAARYRDANLIVLRATTVPVLVIRPDGAPLAPSFAGMPTAKEVAHV